MTGWLVPKLRTYIVNDEDLRRYNCSNDLSEDNNPEASKYSSHFGVRMGEGRSWGEIEGDSSHIYTREMWELLIVS